MSQHNHTFVEEYEGLVGFGMDRFTDENTLFYYLQKFSDDEMMEIIKSRISDEDMEEFFSLLCRFLKKYLNDDEYHRYFLKDSE
jgi:hypothetical protein